MSGVRYSKRLDKILHFIILEYDRLVEEEDCEDPEELALFSVWVMLTMSKKNNSVEAWKALSGNPDSTNQKDPKKQFANRETEGSES